MNEVYILSAVRTPVGRFGGSLAALSAPELAAAAIREAVKRSGLPPQSLTEAFIGNVFSANLGQAPATQAVKFAGLGNIPATGINKVCASGMKAIMLAAQSISTTDNQAIVAGGMESMSNVPYYLDKARTGYPLGNAHLIDGLVKDGLWDVYNDFHMGAAAELCAETCGITREDQDQYTAESYRRALSAQSEGKFKNEIVAVEVRDKKGAVSLVEEDEDIKNVNFDKIPSLKPVFKSGGTVTAANASSLNDGAAALVLAGKEMVEKLGLKPVAKILAFADAQQEPEWFTTAPSQAIPRALERAGIAVAEVDFFEINEAFSVVALANNRELKLDPNKVNINGGAVAIGHPLGASGARIVVTLLNVLQQNNARIGVAAICNGGGGASAIVIENLQLT